VIANDNTLLTDVHYDLSGIGTMYDHSYRRKHKYLRFRSMRRHSGRLAVIAAASSAGYYHFLLDSLPRLVLLKDSGYDTLYAPHDKSFHREAYALLGIEKRRIVPASRRVYWYCADLIVPSLPGVPGCTPPWAVEFLRSMRNLAGARQVRPGQRLYISRADADSRKISNEDEVMAVLAHLGFRRVLLTGMSLRDQIALFMSASHVVAPHGAGLANLVFSEPGTRVVELFPREYVNPCFQHLCASAGHRHAAVISPPPINGEPLNQWVNPDHVKQALESLNI
jgi:capsular polysaccharide biosynthesis protein